MALSPVNQRLAADAYERATNRAALERMERLYHDLAYQCHGPQRAMVTDPSRNLAVLVGGRGGKTTGFRARAVRRAIKTPKAAVLFVASTKEQCRKIFWEPLKDINDRYRLGMEFHETRLEARLPNRSTIKLFGMDDMKQIDSIRGIPWHEVIIDECGAYPPKLLQHFIERVVEPRLDDFPDTSLTIGGTPGHVLDGIFYERTRVGGDPEGYSVHQWSLAEAKDSGPEEWQEHAKRVWARALEKKAEKGWSDDHPVWMREYLGLWAADDTEMVFRYRAYDDEGKLKNCWKPKYRRGLAVLPGTPEDWTYIYSMDEGYKDPFALNIFAVNPYDGEMLHVYCFERTGMYSGSIAELLLGEARSTEDIAFGYEPGDKEAEREEVVRGLFGATGWPSKFVGDIGPGLQKELANTYGIWVERVEKRPDYKHDAIELTNGDFIDDRIKVLYGSHLHHQLTTLQWSVDDFGHLKENKGQANHSTDTLVYARMEAFHHHADEERPPPPPKSMEEAERLRLERLERESKEALFARGRAKQSDEPYADENWTYGDEDEENWS
jgi:hypothetical protein